MENIRFEEFAKIDLRVATIISAAPHPDPSVTKLLVLTVDLGKDGRRTILAGIKEQYPDVSELSGKTIVIVANLEPRSLCGITSTGMVLAVKDGENFSLISPDKSTNSLGIVSNGSKVR